MLEEIIAGAKKNKRLYHRLDLISAIIFILVFIGFPIWWHYDPENGKIIDGRMSLHTKVLILFALPAMSSTVWLGIRYATVLVPRYSFMQTQGFRYFVMLGVPAFVLAIIRIIDILWS